MNSTLKLLMLTLELILMCNIIDIDFLIICTLKDRFFILIFQGNWPVRLQEGVVSISSVKDVPGGS